MTREQLEDVALYMTAVLVAWMLWTAGAALLLVDNARWRQTME